MDPEARALLRRLPALVGDAPAVLVTVLQARGSAPRGPGARLLARDGRLVAGTIGGGNLEARALAATVTVQRDGGPALKLPFALGPELAQCCGGSVTLGLEVIDRAGAERLAALALAPDAEVRSDAEGVGLVERVGVMPTVVVFGAGHVARALAQVLAVLPWRLVVCDGRPEFADPSAFPAMVEVLAEQPAALLAAWGWPVASAPASSHATAPASSPATLPPAPAPAHAAALVMTHDHALDRELVAALLATTDEAGACLDYVGLIGSRTKIASTRRRLRDRLAPEQLDRLVAPIGLRVDGALLGGKLPGEIAISVAAQLIARRSLAP